MKAEIKSEKRIFAALFVACVFLYAIWFFALMSVELCADDFNYSTFLDGKISSFVQKNIEHYKTFNGRVWIHVLDEVMLYIGIPACAVFNVAALALMPYIFGKLDGGKRAPLEMTAIFPIFLMFVGVGVLREGLFWISGSFNYVLPFFMVIVSIFIAKKAAKDNISALLTAVFFIAAFFCGATNEQCGIVSVFVFLYFFVAESCRRRRPLLKNAVLLFAAIAGYVTLFLSPATYSRFLTENDSGATSWEKRLLDVAESIFGEEKLFLVAVLFLLSVFLYSVAKRKSERCRIEMTSVAVIAVLTVLKLVGGRVLYFIMAAVFMIYLAALVIKMFLRRDECAALVVVCGMASVCVMLFTNSAEPRTMLPFALSLCLVGSRYFLSAAKSVNATAAGVMALALCGAAIFAPTFVGYAKNAKIRNENLDAIKASRLTGELYYNIDYELKYLHMPMYSDGYFYNTFVKKYGLENTEIYFCSDKMKPIFVNGERLGSVAYVYEGNEYFPAENIVAALGGSCSWTPERTVFELNGRRIEAVKDVFYTEDGAEDVSNKRAKGYMYTCYTKDVFEKYFGVIIEYDESGGYYTVK